MFTDLREMVEEGSLTYPYSLRELVNIVKHLEAYPSDSLIQGIDNVFHFDTYDTQLKEQLSTVFHKHGVPVGTYFNFSVSLAKSTPLPKSVISEVWNIPEKANQVVESFPVQFQVKGKWTTTSKVDFKVKKKVSCRVQHFTEEKQSWYIDTVGRIEGMACSTNGTIFVLMSHPLQILKYEYPYDSFTAIHLADHLHAYHSVYYSDRGLHLPPPT